MGRKVRHKTPGLADFEGVWLIDREIDDRMARRRLRFEGEARFDRSGRGLDYVETGTLTVPGGAAMKASRAYRWKDAPGGIAVFFHDDRPFHFIDLSGKIPSADHWCDPDMYVVRYGFSGWPCWSSRWSVKGPRKEYVSKSRYRRP